MTSQAASPAQVPVVSIVAALARNRVIGTGDAMPWHLPADLRHFKAVTLGKPVIMGRRTFASIGRALPGRLNIVVTRQPDFAAAGVATAPSLAAAFAAALAAPEICVIGGGEIYAQSLAYARRLELTEIDADFAGTAHFPEIDRGEWREVSREHHATGTDAAFAFDFVRYERVAPPAPLPT
jgi:dihydrofolate reductase